MTTPTPLIHYSDKPLVEPRSTAEPPGNGACRTASGCRLATLGSLTSISGGSMTGLTLI